MSRGHHDFAIDIDTPPEVIGSVGELYTETYFEVKPNSHKERNQLQTSPGGADGCFGTHHVVGYYQPGMPSRTATIDAKYPLDPTLDFMRFLWSIEHGLQRMSKRMEADLGITGPQRLVLRVVGQFPGLSAGELADIVQLHPSTITGVLKRLVAGGLLERERDPADSRRARLRLKPRAILYTHTASGTVEKSVRQALKRVGASNVRAARMVLAEVARSLNEGARRDGRQRT
jgi:DNA-binding MarR family transcriptional regulator